jgi:hypothetical protein
MFKATPPYPFGGGLGERPVAVDQKDALIALTAVSTSLAGFALVFLGIVITRPVSATKLRSDFRIIAGWILIFWLLLLSAGCALAWLYFNAPGSIQIPVLGKMDSGFLYQSAWVLFWLTALISYYVVVTTIRAVVGRDDKATDIKDDKPN